LTRSAVTCNPCVFFDTLLSPSQNLPFRVFSKPFLGYNSSVLLAAAGPRAPFHRDSLNGLADFPCHSAGEQSKLADPCFPFSLERFFGPGRRSVTPAQDPPSLVPQSSRTDANDPPVPLPPPRKMNTLTPLLSAVFSAGPARTFSFPFSPFFFQCFILSNMRHLLWVTLLTPNAWFATVTE